MRRNLNETYKIHYLLFGKQNIYRKMEINLRHMKNQTQNHKKIDLQ